MKALVIGLSALTALTPSVSAADINIQLRARVEARCEVISLQALEGSRDIVVRAACNVPSYTLILEGAGDVVSASSAEAGTAGGPGNVVRVDLNTPGFQTIAITLDQPLASAQDVTPMISFG